MHPLIIASFRSASEAETARAALIAGGMQAETSRRVEGVERVGPDLFPNGFDVVVDAPDADRAIALLRRIWPDQIDVEAAERCPVCGSGDLARLSRIKLFATAASLLIGASLIFGERDLFLLATAIIGTVLLLTPDRRCRACGERWTAKRRS